jgi:hypothetical protein
VTGRLAAAGALAGGALALALTLLFDPAEGSGSTAYEGGARFGEIFRYVLLGAAGGACLERLRAGARGGLLWGVGVLVAAALVIGPAIDTVAEGTPEKRQAKELQSERYRTGFIAGCADRSRAEGAPEAAIQPYCTCLYTTLARDGRMEEARDVVMNDGRRPGWLIGIAQRCAERAVGS